MKRIAALDLERGLAAYAVAIPHYLVLSSQSAPAEVTSVLAVEVFFVLSGFVLAPQILFVMQRQDWQHVGTFLIRRWMRTVPPYLFALILMATVVGQLFTADFWRYALYVQNLVGQANVNDFYSIAWSLSVEEWFYVSLPPLMFVILRCLDRTSDAACALVAVGFIAVMSVLRLALGPMVEWGDEVRRVVVFRIDSIAYGFLFYVGLSHIRRRFPEALARPSTMLGAAAAFAAVAPLAFLATWEIGGGDATLAKHLFPFYAAAFGVAAIFFFFSISRLIERFAPLRWVSAYLGRTSYAVYLFHIIFAQTLYAKLGGLPIATQLAIYLALVASFSTAFYLYFEKPILAARPQYGAGNEAQERRPAVS